MALDKKIILGLLILVAVGAGAFWLLRGSVFSQDVLKLEILGPKKADMGEEITYAVKYKNNGDFALEKAKIIFELPENSLTEDGKHRITQDIQDINPGTEGLITIKTRLLGKEGEAKNATAVLSYSPHNLSARYESSATFSTIIDRVSIKFVHDTLPTIEKDKEVSYSLSYSSDIDYPLENMSIKIDRIDGFSITLAEPTSLDNTEWKLPILIKGKAGRIKIKGILSGNASGSINFSAHLGMWVDGTFIVIKDAIENIQLSKAPAIKIQLQQKAYYSNQDPLVAQSGLVGSGPIPPQVGVPTTYTVIWQVNNYLNKVNNVQIKATLPSNVALVDNLFPEDQAPQFSFDNASRKIFWSLGSLAPGATTSLVFQVMLTPTISQQGMLAPLISQAFITAEDVITGVTGQMIADPITTNLPDDFTNTGGGVVQ